MADIEDILITSALLEEIASDGSTLTNPAADSRRLFLGEDGQLHVKDSAGAVTDIGAGAVATDTIWDAAGDLAIGTGANTAARLASGAAGTVLTGAGVGSAPTWAAAGGGGALVLLEQHTASTSATLDFTTFISSTYDDYVFRLIGLVPATNLVDFDMRLSVASTFDTGSNYVNNHYLQATGGNVSVAATLTAFVARNNNEIGNGAAFGLSGHLDLFNPASTTLGKRIGGNIRWSGNGGTSWVNSIMDGYWTTSGSAVDGVRFFFSSGNIASGTIRVYGYAKT